MENKTAEATHSGNGAKMSLDSISSLFKETWSLYQERFSVLAEIVLLPVLVLILGYILVALGAPFSIIGGLIVIIGEIVFLYASLALIFSIPHNTNVDASYKGVARWFWPLVWLSILDIFIVLGGSVMFLIPGIWL